MHTAPPLGSWSQIQGRGQQRPTQPSSQPRVQVPGHVLPLCSYPVCAVWTISSNRPPAPGGQSARLVLFPPLGSGSHTCPTPAHQRTCRQRVLVLGSPLPLPGVQSPLQPDSLIKCEPGPFTSWLKTLRRVPTTENGTETPHHGLRGGLTSRWSPSLTSSRPATPLSLSPGFRVLLQAPGPLLREPSPTSLRTAAMALLPSSIPLLSLRRLGCL